MFVVELEGFNDGYPYEEWRGTDKAVALERLADLRKTHSRVRWRLIEIVKDYDDAEEKPSEEVFQPKEAPKETEGC